MLSLLILLNQSKQLVIKFIRIYKYSLQKELFFFNTYIIMEWRKDFLNSVITL